MAVIIYIDDCCITREVWGVHDSLRYVTQRNLDYGTITEKFGPRQINPTQEIKNPEFIASKSISFLLEPMNTIYSINP